MATRPRKKVVKKKPASKRAPVKSSSQEGFFGKPPTVLVIYGPPGVGKTSFCAQFPNAGFFIDPQEEGITDLLDYGLVPKPVLDEPIVCDNFQDMIKLGEPSTIKKLKAAGVKNLIGDSITGFERLCFEHHCRVNYDNDWSKTGFYSFMQGPKSAAKTDWPRWLQALDDIRREGITVTLIGHSQAKQYSNPEGEDYDRFIPYLDKETWAQTHKWAKAVLFYNFASGTIKKKGSTKAKADIANHARYINTEWSPVYDAKNRMNLPAMIDAGDSAEEAFANFKEAIQTGK